MKKSIDENFVVDLIIGLDELACEESLRRRVAKKLALPLSEIPTLEIKRKSVDARRGKVQVVITAGPVDTEREQRLEDFTATLSPLRGEPVIIVGAGPAGLFCAYELARLGIRSIVCERGKMVQARRKDLKSLNQHGIVDDDSNYCFGEGGAGTYSDGKLYTRSHKRGSVREVLEILVAFGANNAILTEGRPHIGSNKLPKLILAIRTFLQNSGVEFIFESRMVDLLGAKTISGVKLNDGREVFGKAVVLATGHSARDVWNVLERHGAALEAKPFAMGVRIEHPQTLINEIQYGKYAGHKNLPPAYYRLAYTPSDGRGAFSFCMCPGGWIVPASTSNDGLVVNGMSLAKRDSPFANSGLVVAVSLDDIKQRGRGPTMGGVDLQRQLESHALYLGGGELVAPASRLVDFVDGRLSNDLPGTSYIPGIKAADIAGLLDVTSLPLATRLKEAVRYFEKTMPGFYTNEAIVVGVETRTSSPLRVVRDDDTLMSNLVNLYPCGEGAGYAGGIMSAAIDGIRIARKIKENHTF